VELFNVIYFSKGIISMYRGPTHWILRTWKSVDNMRIMAARKKEEK
jgi:hypothetical protein